MAISYYKYMSLTYINGIQCTCMNRILNMISALYNFVIKPFLTLNSFNTEISNQLIFTVLSQS